MEEEPSSPPPVPPSTLRRNPPRRARHTPFVPASLARFNPASSTAATITPFSLDDAEEETLPVDLNTVSSSSSSSSTNLNVFLRIRPDEIKTHQRVNPSAKTLNPRARSKKSPQKAKKKTSEPCLAVTGPGSVNLTIPKAKLIDSKRGTKNEVYDGFSFVFPPESQQNEVYDKVMDPLVSDFVGGKSSLLVAMGPTGSGKTHTMFGTNRDPGLVPLALKKIFSSSIGPDNPNHQRSFYLAMVEIYSTSGKGEKMIDLLSAGTELTLVQTTIKGLEEVPVSNLEEAERFLVKGMSKRCTAATDANSQSSRSQCIITIRRAKDCFYSGKDSSFGNAVLMIADLAGAERERKTGNLGSRLGESNFINNTSMVFGLCLRSLLEHQKNPKKAFQKHYKDSLLTRYLKDYLEGKKKMTLILTVKRGEEDYMDTSFVLRQASPYMKIKYTNLEENDGPPKRSNAYVFQQENKKRRKVGEKVHADSSDTAEISEKVTEEPKSSSISPKPSENTNTIHYNELLIELEKTKRNEEMMTNFAKAFWKCLNQYKQKLSKSEQDANSMRETLKEKDKEIMELKEELKNLSQNNIVSHSEIALESEISEDLKGFEDYAEVDSRDSDDVASVIVTESDFSLKDRNETVLCEDQISEEEKYDNHLEQKQKEEFLTDKEKMPSTDNETLSTIEQVECNWETENVIQHVEPVNESGSEKFPSSNADEINNDSLDEIDDADERNSSSLILQETLQEIEGCFVVKDQQLDVTCESGGDLKEEKSANVEALEQEMRELKEEKSGSIEESEQEMRELKHENAEEFKEEIKEEMNQEMSSNLDEINQEMSSNSNLEESQQENSGASAEVIKAETITGENEETEEIIHLPVIVSAQDRNSTGSLSLYEGFEQESIANIEGPEDLMQEKSANVEEINEEACIVVKDQQLDATCESAGKSANIAESEQQDMSSNLDEINQKMSSNSNIEKLEQGNSGATAEELEAEMTGENGEIKEQIIDLTCENDEITSSLNLQEDFEIQEEKFANLEGLEDLTQEKRANVEEIKDEISDNIEEIKEEISDTIEELKEEIIDNEEIKEEISAAESEEIKKEIINSPVLIESQQSESTIDNLSEHTEEKSSIERRKSRQPIENLIETIGKENCASSNPGKVNKPKRRLLPASSMLLKEFTAPDSDLDILKEGRGKATAEEKMRSEGSLSLIQILTAKPKLIRDKN